MMTQRSPRAFNEKALLFLLAAVQFMHILDFMVVMPLGPQLMRVFDITPSQFGWLVSIYTFSAAVFGFISAFFIDKLDRKTALLIGCIGFILGTVFCAMATEYPLLLAGRAIAGAFGGMLYALVMSTIGDVIPYHRRGAAMGQVSMAFALSSILGVPFSIWIATIFSWQIPFYIIAGISLLVTIFAYFKMPSIRGHLQENYATAHSSFLSILTKANYLKAYAFMFFLMISQFMVIPFISPYLVSNVGFSELQLTWCYLAGGLSSLISAPLIGKWSDKVGKRRVFISLSIIAVIPMVVVTNLPVTSIPLALIATTLFFIFVGGRIIPAMTLITGSVPEQDRGRFMSINTMVQHVSTGLGAMIASYVVFELPNGKLENFEWSGWLSIVAMALSVMVILRISLADQKTMLSN